MKEKTEKEKPIATQNKTNKSRPQRTTKAKEGGLFIDGVKTKTEEDVNNAG